MVDLRIYRAGIALVVIGLIVFAFSLQDQPGRATTTLAPGVYFSGAAQTTRALARDYPRTTPGGIADQSLAHHVAAVLSSPMLPGFNVSVSSHVAQTAVGARALETVTAVRPGSGPGTIVVVSHRDGTGVADMSGTAVMLGLAQALSAETLHRSVMLVSVSGQVGAAGATELAHSLAGQSVDAVIVLGNLAGARVEPPLVVPWSEGDVVAPPLLRNTVSGFVAQQAGLNSGTYGIGAQIAHLAFPFPLTGQAPINSGGIPAVLVSLSGDRITPADATLGPPGRVAALGTAVLQTVNALDNGGAVAAPSPYLLISGKLVPDWAVRLLVLLLILPVAIATIDALARARRRRHSTPMWIGWVLAGAVPFLVGLVAVLLAKAAGLLSATPPGPVGAAGVPITGGDAAVLAVTLALVIASFVWLRPLIVRALSRGLGGARRPESPAADGAAVSLSLVMCALTFAVWLVNPFSAALLAVALHSWIWLAQPALRARRAPVLTLALLGIVPGILVIAYYMGAYGLSPVGVAWSVTLMIASGKLAVAGIYWSVALGCFASALVIALRAARAGTLDIEPVVTVRGPLSYAGPGSLGGTESALRR
jgi:hypothetical protein